MLKYKKSNNINIVLYGHNPELHDRLIGEPGSFFRTVKKIKYLTDSKQRNNIVLNIPVICSYNENNSNFHRLNDTLTLAKELKLKKVKFIIIDPQINEFTEGKEILASLNTVADYISKYRYTFLFDFLVKVEGIPYCLIPEPESVITKSNNRKAFVKLSKCNECRYFEKCDGILNGFLYNFKKEHIIPQRIPREIMIEVTPFCNFKCSFCFNHASFANSKEKIKPLSRIKILNIIDQMADAKIPIVRFTGGEPLLREDMLDLIKYSHKRGLEVRLNTNGYFFNSYAMVQNFSQYLEYVLFSMHTFDPRKDEAITGVKNSFEKKIQAIKWFKKAGIKTIRVSTIASIDNINNLEKFYKFFVDLNIDKWATNRLIPLKGQKNIWGQKELVLLVDKLTKIRKDVISKRLSLKAHIVNAVPLCALDPIKMNSVCSGGRSVDGHERFVIDPRGFAKPIYYIDKNIGDSSDLLSCWDNEFMKNMRTYQLLPKECQKCPLLDKCKGGNRYCAFVDCGSYGGKDPLMDYNNIKSLAW